MREIKFRVWNDKEMLYIKHGENLQLNFGINDGWSLWDSYEELCDHKQGELMQYTGLKDKNGKEIYEGDIGEGENAIYLIQWDTERAQFKAKIIKTKSILTKHCSFPLWQYVEDGVACRIKITGNIYENPELIQI